VSDGVRQRLELRGVLDDDEVATDRLAGDRLQLTRTQVLPDADDDHRYAGVARPRRRRYGLVGHGRAAGRQQNGDAPDFPGPTAAAAVAGFREPVECHLLDRLVRVGVVRFLQYDKI